MDFTELFKQQQDWLNKAQAALTATTAPVVDPKIPSDNTQKRIDEINNQIAALKKQQEATARQIDAAIAERTDQLTRLKAQLPQDKKLIQDVASATETSTKSAGTEAPSKEADADTSPSKDAETRTRTKEAPTKTPPKTAKTKTRTKK